MMDEEYEAQRLGDALANLRRERGLSQAEAGARIGMTSQGWGLYEAGKRAGLFRPDMQRKLTSALDATPEDLLLVAGAHLAPAPTARPLPDSLSPERQGVAASGRAFDGAKPVMRQRWRLDHDGMAPWAYAGVILEYVPDQWPRRDQGCLIELASGERHLGLYDTSDEQRVLVRTPDGVQRAFYRAMILRVSAVVARFEE